MWEWIKQNKRYADLSKFGMWIISTLAAVYVCLVILGTTYRAIYVNGDGAGLLTLLGTIPAPLWMTPLGVGLGYLLFSTSFYLRYPDRIQNEDKLFWCYAELIMSLILTVCLHFAYNGYLLLAFAGLLDEYGARKHRELQIGYVGLYVLTSIGAVRDRFGVISIEQYLQYYNTHVASLMQSVLTIFTIANIICFVVYMISVVQKHLDENERIVNLNNQLMVMNERIRAHAAESEEMAATRERNRLAREIHDTIGHALTGIAAASDACAMMIDTSPLATKELLKEISASARQGITDVRRSVNKLRPDALEHKTLIEAVQEMIDHINATTQVKIRFYPPSANVACSPDEEETVYRIVQEGITNSVRHGHATEIEIVMAVKENQFEVWVQDNGYGLLGPCKEDFGLVHMRERLEMLQGTLDYDGTNGFVLHAAFPMRKGEVRL